MATASGCLIGQVKAVALLEALGCKDAGGFDAEKLAKRLKKIPGKLEDESYTVPDDFSDELKDVLDNVKAAVEADEEITVKAGKGGKKGGGEKKPKGERKPPEIKRDDYGNRLGSDSAKINTGLKSKPQSTEKIAEAVGLSESRVKDHLNYWHKKKPELFGKDENGKFYSLLGKGGGKNEEGNGEEEKKKDKKDKKKSKKSEE